MTSRYFSDVLALVILLASVQANADTYVCESRLDTWPVLRFALEHDPLMAAVLTRNYHQIEELRRKDRSTELLFAASRSGRIDVVRYLASRGVDMDVIHPELGLAPLSVAIGSGCELMVRTLVELGADVNLQYSAGVTPLWTAAMDGSEPLVRVMLELGADPTLGRSNFGDLASTLSAVGMPRMAKLINEATRHGDAP